MDLSKVFPRVKGIDSDFFPDPDIRSSENEFSLSVEDSPVFTPITNGLALFYGIDKGQNYQLILNRDIQAPVTLDQIHAASLSNLAAAVDGKIEITGNAQEILMLTNGGNFEATMILVDFIWKELKSLLQDEIVIAIPAKDLLFITKKNNEKGMEKLREMIRFYYDQRKTEGLITRHLYERIGQGWSYVETVE